MRPRPTPDMFDGIFDNASTGRREVWKDGRLSRYVRRNAVGSPESQWREVHEPWGSFPDHPSNAARKTA